jgi:hypothetical protein
MKFYERDVRVYNLLNKHNKVLTTQAYVCFGNILGEQLYMTRKTNPATHIEHYFISNLNLTQTRGVLKELKALNVFRNVEVKIVNKCEKIRKAFDYINETKETLRGHPIVQIRADVSTCSPQEYQFVGFIMRQFSNAPDILLNWLNLIQKHLKEDRFHLYIIAHNIKEDAKNRLNKDSLYYGHYCICPNFNKIKDFSVKKIYSILDSYTVPFKKSSIRGFASSLSNMMASWESMCETPKPYNKELVEKYLSTIIKE